MKNNSDFNKEYDLNKLNHIEKQIKFLQSVKIKLKRQYGIGIYCCRISEASNGWHHALKCKNNRLTF